jgi:multisubunit Na+/H+ antiporter MnhC subunit
VTPTVVLPVVVGCLYAAGAYLLMDRSLTRVLVGFLLLSNATVVLLLSAGGRAGDPPFVGTADPARTADPLPQALVLTAIVITLGVTAFVLAMVHRSWRLVRREVMERDDEDRRIAARRHAEGTDSLDPDDADPDALAPEHRAPGHDDRRPARDGDRRAERVLAERYAGTASDDVDLPPTRGGQP